MPGAMAGEPEEFEKCLGRAKPRGVTRQCAHPWALPMISISLFFLVPVQASSQNCLKTGRHHRRECEDPNNQRKCIDSQSNRVVNREMCTERCCVYRHNKLSRQQGIPAEQLPHCGTRKECDVQSAKNRPTKKDELSWEVLLSVSAGLVIPFIVIASLLAYRSRHGQPDTEKPRDIELLQILDEKCPAMMYDDLDDPEQQLDYDERCCICLDLLQGSMVRKLNCSHVLHQYCFDRWCLDSSERRRKKHLICKKSESSFWTCPLCRNPAVPADGLQLGSLGETLPISSAAEEEDENRPQLFGSDWVGVMPVGPLG